MHSTSHYKHTHTCIHTYACQTCRLIFHFQFFIFFFIVASLLFFSNFALLAKQFSHANFKWNRIQLLLSRRGARDRKVEATENENVAERGRSWRGACVARALKCVSILNVRLSEQSRTSVRARAQRRERKSPQWKLYTTSIFTGFYSALALALPLSLSLSAPFRSQLIWDLCERRSARTVWLISSLSRISFSFSICVEKFIHALLLFECACCRLAAACVCKYWWVLTDWACFFLHAYRAVTENSRSRWRKQRQHASSDRPRCRGVCGRRLIASHMPKGCLRERWRHRERNGCREGLMEKREPSYLHPATKKVRLG